MSVACLLPRTCTYTSAEPGRNRAERAAERTKSAFVFCVEVDDWPAMFFRRPAAKSRAEVTRDPVFICQTNSFINNAVFVPEHFVFLSSNVFTSSYFAAERQSTAPS